MKIAILSRNKNLYSTNRLFNAGTKRGHRIDVIDYLRCYINIGENQTAIYYKKPLSDLKFNWITKDINLKNVNNIKKRILCIPIYPSLTIKKQNYVIKSIKEFYEA